MYLDDKVAKKWDSFVLWWNEFWYPFTDVANFRINFKCLTTDKNWEGCGINDPIRIEDAITAWWSFPPTVQTTHD